MNRRLDEYVRDVEKRLTALPAKRREEEVAEIRQHLEALAAAEQELGVSESEAITVAIRQFGAAPMVARQLNQTQWRRQLQRLPESFVTALSVLAVWPSIWLASIFLLDPVLRDLLPPVSPSHCLTPSQMLSDEWWWFVYAAAAAAILVLRDGMSASLRRLTAPGSSAAAAFQWLVASTVLRDISGEVLGHWARVGVPMTPGPWEIAIAIANMLSPAVLPAWYIARTAGRSAAQAVASTCTAVAAIDTFQRSIYLLELHRPELVRTTLGGNLVRAGLLLLVLWTVALWSPSRPVKAVRG